MASISVCGSATVHFDVDLDLDDLELDEMVQRALDSELPSEFSVEDVSIDDITA